MEIKFLGVEELSRMIDGLSAEEKEELAGQLFNKLSAESKARVIGLNDCGLTVITGSFVSLNSDIAINVQNSNSSNLDAEAIVKALIEWKKSKK